MNNARIWTIVNPSVGIPLFFLGVMFTSLYIHYQVINNTDWFSGFFDEEVAAAQRAGQ